MNIFLVEDQSEKFYLIECLLCTQPCDNADQAAVCPTVVVKDTKNSLICPPKESLLLKETQTIHFNIPFVFQGRLSCLHARKPVD